VRLRRVDGKPHYRPSIATIRPNDRSLPFSPEDFKSPFYGSFYRPQSYFLSSLASILRVMEAARRDL